MSNKLVIHCSGNIYMLPKMFYGISRKDHYHKNTLSWLSFTGEVWTESLWWLPDEVLSDALSIVFRPCRVFCTCSFRSWKTIAQLINGTEGIKNATPNIMQEYLFVVNNKRFLSSWIWNTISLKGPVLKPGAHWWTSRIWLSFWCMKSRWQLQFTCFQPIIFW